MSLHCPKCEAPMEVVQVESTQVDRCTSCHGLWFDALEDKDLMGSPAVELLDPPGAHADTGRNAQRGVDCPRCHTRLIRMVDRRNREVTYESCPVCYGKFFDPGEFRAVQPRSLTEALRQMLKGSSES